MFDHAARDHSTQPEGVSNVPSNAFQRPSNALPSGVTTAFQRHTNPLPTACQRGAFQPPHTPPAHTRALGCAHVREGSTKNRDRSPSQKLDTDALVRYMPIIVRADGVTAWERKFCASIIAASRRKKPTPPSAKQVAIMQRIVTEFRDRTMGDDGGVLE